MVIDTRGNGKMELKREMEFFNSSMEISILVNLKKINFQEKDYTLSQMAINIKENFFKAFNMGKENTNLVHFTIKDNGHLDKKRVEESLMVMEKLTKVSGIVLNQGMENILGQMEISLKEVLLMMFEKVEGLINGSMESRSVAYGEETNSVDR